LEEEEHNCIKSEERWYNIPNEIIERSIIEVTVPAKECGDKYFVGRFITQPLN
jgi:hypothetical protein